ncbi:hypothetical protein ACWCPQ_15885 [Nocardia sp. NPDC001965]
MRDNLVDLLGKRSIGESRITQQHADQAVVGASTGERASERAEQLIAASARDFSGDAPELTLRRADAEGTSRAWDWLDEQLPDWPAGRRDDIGLTLSDTAAYSARSTGGNPRVVLETAGERGDRTVRVRIFDRGDSAPPDDVLDDPVFGRLEHRLSTDDPAGWTREISFSARETPALPQWLGDALQSARHVRLNAGDDLAIGVRSKFLPRLEEALGPLSASGSPVDVAKDDIDAGLRHAARINHARLHAGSTDLELSFVQLRSGEERVELSVYPFWDQDFRDGLRQLDVQDDGSTVISVTDFANAVLARAGKGGETPATG